VLRHFTPAALTAHVSVCSLISDLNRACAGSPEPGGWLEISLSPDLDHSSDIMILIYDGTLLLVSRAAAPSLIHDRPLVICARAQISQKAGL